MGERFTKEEAHAEQKKNWGKRALKRHGERMRFVINFNRAKISWAECHSCSVGVIDGKPQTFNFIGFDEVHNHMSMTDLIARKASILGRGDF